MTNKPEIVEGNIDDLKPLSDNPMKHGKKNKDTTVQSLKEVGFSRSLAAHKNNDGSMHLLAGHGTLDAAKEVGLKKVVYVPIDGETIVVTVREGMTQEEQYRYAMYDNAAAKQAVFDGEALENIRFKRGIKTEGIFTEKEFETHVNKSKDKQQIQPTDDDDAGQTFGDVGYYIIVECEEKSEQQELFDELTGDGYKVVKYEGQKRGDENGKSR